MPFYHKKLSSFSIIKVLLKESPNICDARSVLVNILFQDHVESSFIPPPLSFASVTFNNWTRELEMQEFTLSLSDSVTQ